MSPWRLTITQVEAGYAAYRWALDNAYSKEIRTDSRWYDSVAAAEAAARAFNEVPSTEDK